jgi:hypothetical protein
VWDLEIEYSGAQRNEGEGKMRRLILLIFFACTCPLTCCLLPPLPSIFLDEEVADNEEGIDYDTNTAADAKDIAAAAATAAADDNASTMPPKVKPLTTKPTKKGMAAASAKPPPPAAAASAAAATSFSVDAEDPITVSSYAVGAYDYADVAFRVNGTMHKSEYQVRVAEDSLLVSFVRAISSMSFDKKIIRKIMGAEYRESSSRVVAWDDTALAMQAKNVCPVNGLFWGKLQVVRLMWKCTGTPTAVNKHDYPTEYKVRDNRGVWHVQCDCIVIVTVRKAEERTQAELEVSTSYVDLFGIDSSQSQRSDDPLSPPRRRRKKRRSEDREDRRQVEDNNDDDNDDDDGGGGGKLGGGYGGGDGGGGKRKKGF